MSTAQRRRGARLPAWDMAKTPAGKKQALDSELAKRIKRRKGRNAEAIRLHLLAQVLRHASH